MTVKRLVNLKKEGFIIAGTFEHYSQIESETSDKVKFILGGQMDYANKLDKTIFEFKCVENLDTYKHYSINILMVMIMIRSL